MDDALARTLLAAVDAHGILLVHDQALPCITAIAAGRPISGSWWSHLLANPIYNALGALEGDLLRTKLVLGKDTLAARRVWPEVLGVATCRLDSLTTGWPTSATRPGSPRLLPWGRRGTGLRTGA